MKNNQRAPVPWWAFLYSQAIKDRLRALKKVKATQTLKLINFQRICAKANVYTNTSKESILANIHSIYESSNLLLQYGKKFTASKDDHTPYFQPLSLLLISL